MASSQGGGRNEKSAPVEIKDGIYPENEIYFIDYFRVLWKRKCFIFLATVLPTLIVGITLFIRPGDYKICYVYDVSNWNLTEKDYNILINRFYSKKNLNEIVNRLQEGGFNQYAKLIEKTENNADALMKVLKIEPAPAYMDISKTTGPEKIILAQKLTAQLLKVSILGKDKNKLPKIAFIIKDNFEKEAPVCAIKEQLAANIRLYRTCMGDIESSKFKLELELKTNKEALEKLKKIKSTPPDSTGGNTTLQFDIGNKMEYLPISYQIHATEYKVIELEKQISTNEYNYNYYKNLFDLDEKLFDILKDKTSSCPTIEQFHSLIVDMAKNCNQQELKDYLSSYTKSIENRISDTVPTTETPRIHSVTKGTAKKSGAVFLIAFMVSVFSALLWEGFERD